ncbi:MAG: hypothetical protein LC802_02315 [Acidobacteria bacterium]|nr:hypothetical protein [Acidobacteriota bacterium]
MRNERVRASAAKACAIILVALFGAAVLTPAGAPAAEKMKPEEVVAKHLEAIGTAELRAPSRSRVASGDISIVLRNSAEGGRPQGKGLIASEGNKVLLNAAFEAADIPFERMGFDGKKLTIRQYRPGRRTAFGEFMLSHEVVFKEGLIGGALTSAWPLLNLAERNPKLEYNGTDKINGRSAHKLGYKPRKGSDLKIKLFFDAETFRHVRTEYERVVAATMGGVPGASAGRVDTRYQFVEEFSDFKTEEGLTLPHTYSLRYMVTSEIGPVLMNWKFTLSEFSFNQAIDAKEFDTER